MKHFNIWAMALLFSIGLSSCALSYPYCDAYNGVELDRNASEAVDGPGQE